MDVTLTGSLEGITTEQLAGGFFEGWPDPPSAEVHLELLRGSRRVALAIDEHAARAVVGYVTAVGDGVLSAYIPLLEVLPEYRGHGIGTRLVEHVIEQLAPCYMVDLACDDDLVPMYERLGFVRANAMCLRDYDVQAGSSATTSR